MGNVLTNNSSFAYSIEASLGVLQGSPEWFLTEPNAIGAFGATPTKVKRTPISKLRQNRKGTVVDVDNPTEMEVDMTMSAIRDFAEGFLYSVATNSDMMFRGLDAVAATGYTIPAATAAQGAKIQFVGTLATLFYAVGYGEAANNGIFPVTADTASTGTTIARSSAVVETAPINAEVSLAGIRAEAGDLALVVAGTIGTLTSGNNAAVNNIDFTTIGWTVGQRVHIGGDTATNRFFGAGPIVSYGGARIRTIAAGTVTFDKLDATLITSDGTDTGAGGTLVPVDLLFSQFIRNVRSDHADYLERSYQFEAEFPNLYETDPPTPVAEPDGYWYSLGNRANEMSINNPLTDKATMNFAFIGQTSEAIVDGASRKANAATPIEPINTEAFNTAADFFRLGILDVDETGLTTDFTDMTATVNNNASGEKVLGFVGNKFINNGNFEFSIATTALFTSPLVVSRVLDNTDVTMGWVQRNNDGAISVDVPSAELDSDGLEIEPNVSIKIQLTVNAFVDSFFGTSIGMSLWPFYPAA
tara:strand:- start:21357 stop:22943 length:1587 start_codon:yes stop_codon:yes gene_type:complete